MAKNHPLHKIIADCIDELQFPNCKIIRDTACGGRIHIPLFYSYIKSRETQYCNVDLLILKDEKIRVIIEIEESDRKPTQICGKFLTSALSNCFIHKKYDKIKMEKPISFIQILDVKSLKQDKTKKIKQGEILEKSINNILPISTSAITEYRSFYVKHEDFKNRKSNNYVKFFNYLKAILQ